MQTFEKLLAQSKLRRQQLSFIRTLEDLDLVQLIGANQARGRPFTLKLVFLEQIGSVATVQRRLSRLTRLGIVVRTRASDDKRNMLLTINPTVCNTYKRIGRLMRKTWAEEKT